MVHLVNGELVEVEHVLCIELGLCIEQILLDCRPLESGHVATVVRLNGYGCPIAQIVATDLQLLASAFTQENVLLAYGPNGGRGWSVIESGTVFAEAIQYELYSMNVMKANKTHQD